MVVLKKKQTAPPLYETVSGTTRGASHRKAGIPNQDAICVPASNRGDSVAVAVGDGHGSKRYVRSNIGSLAATQTGCEVLRGLVDADYGEGNPSAMVAELARTKVPSALINSWLTRIEADLLENPLGPCDLGDLDEKDAKFLQDNPVKAYGTTLLAAAVCKDFGMVTRVGDGVIRVIDHEGRIFTPLPEEHGTGTEATDSMAMVDSTKIHTDFLHFGGGIPKCIFLATDGYSKQFADAGAIDRAVMQVFEYLTDHGPEQFSRALTKLLEDTTKNTGDDVSIAMIVLRDLLPENPTKGGQRRFA